MSFRDWLIVVGVIIILGILIDGYRRMRLARMDSLKMSRDMGGEFENSPLDDDFNPELPGGGARVVSPGVESEQGEKIEPSLFDDDVAQDTVTESGEALNADASDRVETTAVKTARASKQPAKTTEARQSEPDRQSPQEVLIINVDAKTDTRFHGLEIKKLLEACGLEHGEMSIFHRHEEDDLLSPVQFSVANAVEPGYFDPEKMDTLSTPGVSFFMSLPGPKDYMKAFDFMLETAQCFAKNLGGELRDEQRSVMTTQTIEHCRQRIREFERKQLSLSRA